MDEKNRFKTLGEGSLAQPNTAKAATTQGNGLASGANTLAGNGTPAKFAGRRAAIPAPPATPRPALPPSFFGGEGSPPVTVGRGVTPTDQRPFGGAAQSGIASTGRTPLATSAPTPSLISPQDAQVQQQANISIPNSTISTAPRGLLGGELGQKLKKQNNSPVEPDGGIRIIRGNFNGTGNSGVGGGFDVSVARPDGQGNFVEGAPNRSLQEQSARSTALQNPNTARSRAAQDTVNRLNPNGSGVINDVLAQERAAAGQLREQQIRSDAQRQRQLIDEFAEEPVAISPNERQEIVEAIRVRNKLGPNDEVPEQDIQAAYRAKNQ